MYLHILDEEQKRNFFALAIRMILTDGVIKPEEISYLNQLISESGIPGEVSLVQSVESPDLSIYKTRAVRMAVATELMIIANVDGRLHDLEAALFNGVINGFHLTGSDMTEIRALATDCSQLFQQGNALIGD
jgi:uncharacterized tellurite resistance protein B-like protein